MEYHLHEEYLDLLTQDVYEMAREYRIPWGHLAPEAQALWRQMVKRVFTEGVREGQVIAQRLRSGNYEQTYF
ncbi:MAG: hypothetical protein R3362_04785 [Rhodothermales bacterium]|nr:hypothetical protein [Rhodothermales bacterium]